MASRPKPKRAPPARPKSARPHAVPAKRAARPPPPKRKTKAPAPKGAIRTVAGSARAAPPAPPASEMPPLRPIGREHVLSLSFLRDGDEFTARLETDSGQITEIRNRSLDQLLSLVASELEDLLE